MDLGASLSWSPDPVGPGKTADVTVVFDNQTSAAGARVTATLSLPEGGTIAEPTQDVGTIEGSGRPRPPGSSPSTPTSTTTGTCPCGSG